MDVRARRATETDLGELVRLYRLLEQEMVALKAVWALADGLAEPAEASLKEALEEPDATLWVGEIEGVPLGFVLARVEPLLEQGGDGTTGPMGAPMGAVGAVRLIFTEPQARGVGLGEVMLEAALDELRGRGLRLFDAHVLPGHRDAKNFFEAAEFSARSIVMHHEDEG
ncbi:MAG: GNAT family N-acetyltransferase [Actinomycetota bacterium]|nr:GNAT family N-acetyltransferase [Actinomycetota bacterium]